MGSRRGREVEPARQVRVQDVEAARAESERARLHVDEHVVAEGDRAGDTRVRDARRTVHLATHEPLVALDDGGNGTAPKRERHRAARG